MAKPITSVALMMLVEEGLVGLDDDVGTHIPSWSNLGCTLPAFSLVTAGQSSFLTTPVKRPMKVVDLATHTSGLTHGFMNRSSVDRAYRQAQIAEFGAEGGSRRHA
jgi:CubicO group peptidase (beta-lactamase class C family)